MIGARIRNAGGSLIQIDPSYENLALKQTGILTTSQLGPSSPASSCGISTISVSGCNEPVISVSCSTAYVGIRKRTQSGSTYSWEIISSSPIVSFTYYIFDTTDVAQMAFASTKGMRIRREQDSKVVFDSRYKYLRVINQIIGTASNTPVSFSVTNSDSFSVGISSASNATLVVSGPVGGSADWRQDISSHVVGFMTNPSSVSVKGINTFFVSNTGTGVAPASGNFGTFQIQALILDVKNY